MTLTNLRVGDLVTLHNVFKVKLPSETVYTDQPQLHNRVVYTEVDSRKLTEDQTLLVLALLGVQLEEGWEYSGAKFSCSRSTSRVVKDLISSETVFEIVDVLPGRQSDHWERDGWGRNTIIVLRHGHEKIAIKLDDGPSGPQYCVRECNIRRQA